MIFVAFALFVLFSSFAVASAKFGCSPLNNTIAPHWCPKGHSATAALAQSLLSPRTQAELLRILPEVNGQLEPLSSWPDDVRNEAAWSWSAGLHFINTPDWQCDYSRAQDCQDAQFPGQFWCVDGAIMNYSLRASEPSGDQRHAVIFLTHFLGDIHQPLHVSFSSDWGGNKILVNFLGLPTELHLVWDDNLINARIERDYSDSYYTWAAALLEQLRQLTQSQRQAWLECDPMSVGPFGSCSRDWGRESAKLACTNAYSHVDGSPIRNNDTLGEDYYQLNIKLVEQRILQGGVRLANILNSIFDPMEHGHDQSLTMEDAPLQF